jgi:hypothetical protein
MLVSTIMIAPSGSNSWSKLLISAVTKGTYGNVQRREPASRAEQCEQFGTESIAWRCHPERAGDANREATLARPVGSDPRYG